ncbi:carbonic anhydrase [Corynebacterium kroppenstedtii]|uniref:carbonic anhydrase n=1 Tax=Corynebacterium sp. PCR 32 TaxID=3351342 RepID=UPI00309BFA38
MTALSPGPDHGLTPDAASTASGKSRTPASVLHDLLDGNDRFVQGRALRPNQDRQHWSSLTQGQAPKAVVLACSDSRVPVELLFDQGFGDVFVIRTAGEIVDMSVLASLEFAVEGLGVSLVVVLGHESCGAVKAASEAMSQGGVSETFQRVLVEKVAPSVMVARAQGHFTTDDYEKQHVRSIVDHIVGRSPEIITKLDDGTIGVVGLRYLLKNGEVEVVTARGSAIQGEGQ